MLNITNWQQDHVQMEEILIKARLVKCWQGQKDGMKPFATNWKNEEHWNMSDK